MLDVDRLAEAMLEGARALIAKELAPLREANEALRHENEALAARVKGLEDRPVEVQTITFDRAEIKAIVDEAVAGLELKEPGDLDDRIKAVVDEHVRSAVAAIPQPEVPDVAEMVAKAVAAIPVPENGKDADPAVIKAMVNEAVAAIPPARDGKDADPAELQAVKEAVAELRGWKDAMRIPEAIHGKDGRSIVSARINDDGELVLKYSDGDTQNLGRIKGQDGKDAFEIEALAVEYDGERSFSIGWPDGRKAVFDLPVPIYRGVWKGGAYKRGDTVTWGGSQFTAVRDTEAKPEMDGSWQLSVKRGRDGREVVRAALKSEPVKLEDRNAG